eukprot:2638978-Amphidinium_carterae.1
MSTSKQNNGLTDQVCAFDHATLVHGTLSVLVRGSTHASDGLARSRGPVKCSEVCVSPILDSILSFGNAVGLLKHVYLSRVSCHRLPSCSRPADHCSEHPCGYEDVSSA